MQNTALRYTPLTVVQDISGAISYYESMGFEVVEKSSPECVGLRLETAHLILASEKHMQKDFAPHAVKSVLGKTIPYIHVKSLDVAKSLLQKSDSILQEVRTHYGTDEALCQSQGQLVILAETKE